MERIDQEKELVKLRAEGKVLAKRTKAKGKAKAKIKKKGVVEQNLLDMLESQKK